MSRFVPFLLIVGMTTSFAGWAGAEWNQWRGPGRNGIAEAGEAGVGKFPESGLPVLWETGAVPGDHDGGHGSPVTAGGRIYLSLVWHNSVPSEKRVIEEDHLVSLGYRDTSLLGDALTARLEETRRGLDGRLRGEALHQWIREWVQDHFDEEQRLILGSWAEWRLGQKGAAVDLAVLNQIAPKIGFTFANHGEMVRWLTETGIEAEVQERLLRQIPTTIKVAEDVVICWDAATGRELWRAASPGKAVGRSGSSTCTVVGSTVYALGSAQVQAVDAVTGQIKWRHPLKRPGGGSSPLVSGDRLWVVAGGILCLSTKEGKVLWEQGEMAGEHASPVLWDPPSGSPVLLCQMPRQIVALHTETGQLQWTLPGGGPSTPVVRGDRLIAFTEGKNGGLQCFLAQPSGPPREEWRHWWLASRHSASPVVHEGHVYLMEGGRHLCLSLADGQVRWEEKVESTISSPVLVGDTLLILEQNGLFLRAVKASPAAYTLVGRSKVEALWCPTPLPLPGRVVTRQKDRLQCLALPDS
jgi:outer membrane protein assembly factor BamB